MKKFLLATTMLLAGTGMALAKGELNIYNWGNYTNPDLIKKFEKEYDVKVTMTDYDSNDTALAKVEAGGSRLRHRRALGQLRADLRQEGAADGSAARPDGELQECRSAMGRRAVGSGPPLHRAVAMGHHRRGGEHRRLQAAIINTSAIFLDPPPELVGKVNVVPEMNDVISLAIMYEGGEACTDRQGGAEEGARRADGGQAEVDEHGLRHDREDVEQRRHGLGQLERLDLPASARTIRRWSTAIPRRAIRCGWIRSPSSRTRRMSTTPSCS